MLSPEDFGNFVNNQSKEIEGWFFPADMLSFWMLGGIQGGLGIRGDVCEVGVYHGKSLVLLSNMLSENEIAHGYDIFPDNTREKTEEALLKFGRPEKTWLYSGDTSTISRDMLDDQVGKGVRLLHIDAGHEYHEVYHQLITFSPYVAHGGIIIMDDYQDREFPGIEAAVLDFSEIDRPRRFVPFYASGNKMFLCEPHFSYNYQSRLIEQGPLKDACRVSRVRDFNILVGFSKLPVSNADCIERIVSSDFPKYYHSDSEGLRAKAEKYSQLHYGPGKHQD